MFVMVQSAWAGWYLMVPPPPPDLGQSGKWESLGAPISTRWWIERSFDNAADCEAERSRYVLQANGRRQARRERPPSKSGDSIPVEVISDIQQASALCIATDDRRLATPER